jgi:hypothetical protein
VVVAGFIGAAAAAPPEVANCESGLFSISVKNVDGVLPFDAAGNVPPEYLCVYISANISTGDDKLYQPKADRHAS